MKEGQRNVRVAPPPRTKSLMNSMSWTVQGGAKIYVPSRQSSKPTQPYVQRVSFLSGDKAVGAWYRPPSSSSAGLRMGWNYNYSSLHA